VGMLPRGQRANLRKYVDRVVFVANIDDGKILLADKLPVDCKAFATWVYDDYGAPTSTVESEHTLIAIDEWLSNEELHLSSSSSILVNNWWILHLRTIIRNGQSEISLVSDDRISYSGHWSSLDGARGKPLRFPTIVTLGEVSR